MRVRDLEIALSRVPPHPAPRADLEQYATPADVAARLLHEAWALGDIGGKRVLDLGCGTGVLGLGAALLGAREVVGVEVDAAAAAVARAEAARLGVAMDVRVMDVRAWGGSADAVVMNPPFGAQAPGRDRAFLDAAFRSARVVYTIHNAPTRAFVEAYAGERGFVADRAWALRLALRHQYAHQERATVDVDAIAFRFIQSLESGEGRAQ